MPSLAELTDYYPQTDNSLPVEQPYLGVPQDNDGLRRVYITGNTAIAPAVDKPITDDRPEPRPEPLASEFNTKAGKAVDKILNKLTGSAGEERYQLWPEKVVREGLSGAHDIIQPNPYPNGSEEHDWFEDQRSKGMVPAALAISALAGTGGLAGADATLGATPFLRPALKYENKIYKAPVGGQHLDALPKHLAEDFQTKAMNGEDINHYNFGFMNHKGQFLDREKALDYAIKEGLVDPSAGQYGVLTSTLMADSSKPGTAIEAMGKVMKPPKVLYRGIVEGAQESGASGLGTSHLGKGLYTSADKSFAKKYASKGEIKEFSPEDAFPSNPLVLNGAGGAGNLLMDYIFKNTNFKNAREINKAYPDIGQFVRELGYDGVVVNKGEEIVKYPRTLFADSSKESAALQANKMPVKISYDNPGGEWLKHKQEDALEKRKFTNGSPTAFARDVALPTDLLSKVKGLKDENRVPGDPQYDALLKEVKEKGWKNDSPILIKINHKGEPYISEGNTRVAVAKAVGQETVPAWIDWMNGAELTASEWHPDNLKPLMTSTKDKYKLVPVEGDPFK